MSNIRSIKIISGVILSTLLLLGAGILFFRSNKAPNQTSIIRRYNPNPVTSLDIQEVHDTYNESVARHLYEPLLHYHHTTEGAVLSPLLLEALPTISKDRLLYTFKIKKGVHFHDNKCFTKTKGKGKELTAHDVAFSLIRIFDPAIPCAYMSCLQDIKGAIPFRKARQQDPTTPYAIEGIHVVDTYTLTLTLDKPINNLRYFLAMNFTSILCEEAVNYYKEKFRFNPVGTGPWILAKPFKLRATKLFLKKNPNYHACFPDIVDKKFSHMKSYVGKKLPLMQELHIEIIKEPTAAWLKFNNNELDILDNIEDIDIYNNSIKIDKHGNKKIKKKLKEKGINIQDEINTSMRFIHFNLYVKQLQNQKVRQAIALAIDLDRIIRVTADGYAKPAHGMLLPGFEHQGYDPSYKAPYTTKVDIAQAKSLLAEAGYPNAQGLNPLTVYLTNHPLYQKIAPCLKEDLAKIGIKINIVFMPFSDLTTKTREKGSTAWSLTCSAWGLDIPDMINFFQLFYSKNIGGTNASGYNNQTFDKLFEQASNMEPSPKRTALYVKMNKMLARDVPSIPFFIKERYDFVNTKLKNRRPNINFVHDQYKYMTKEKQATAKA